MNEISYPCATKQGYIVAHEGDGIVMQRPERARGTVQRQTSPTLLCGRGGGAGVVVKETKLENVGAILTPGRMTKSQNGRRCKSDDTAFAITSSDVNGVIGQEGGKLRIRYLTPRECLRLMGFPETQIDKLMEAVPSKTNLYKLAGNSIVVDCLESIFKAIYIDGTFRNERKKQKSLDGFLTGVNPIVGRSPEEVEEKMSKLEGIGQ